MWSGQAHPNPNFLFTEISLVWPILEGITHSWLQVKLKPCRRVCFCVLCWIWPKGWIRVLETSSYWNEWFSPNPHHERSGQNLGSEPKCCHTWLLYPSPTSGQLCGLKLPILCGSDSSAVKWQCWGRWDELPYANIWKVPAEGGKHAVTAGCLHHHHCY